MSTGPDTVEDLGSVPDCHGPFTIVVRSLPTSYLDRSITRRRGCARAWYRVVVLAIKAGAMVLSASTLTNQNCWRVSSFAGITTTKEIYAAQNHAMLVRATLDPSFSHLQEKLKKKKNISSIYASWLVGWRSAQAFCTIQILTVPSASLYPEVHVVINGHRLLHPSAFCSLWEA